MNIYGLYMGFICIVDYVRVVKHFFGDARPVVVLGVVAFPEFRIIQIIFGNSEMVPMEHVGLNLQFIAFCFTQLGCWENKKGTKLSVSR